MRDAQCIACPCCGCDAGGSGGDAGLWLDISGCAHLFGGEAALLQRTRDAAEAGDHQWAMELADLLITLGSAAAEATAIKIDCLTALAETQLNATARNYYLVCAKELRDADRS